MNGSVPFDFKVGSIRMYIIVAKALWADDLIAFLPAGGNDDDGAAYGAGMHQALVGAMTKYMVEIPTLSQIQKSG